MGEFRGTYIQEPADCETLYFNPSWYPDYAWLQTMAIGSVEKEIASIIFARQYENSPYEFSHIILTLEEVNLVIEALQKLKRRWLSPRWKDIKNE